MTTITTLTIAVLGTAALLYIVLLVAKVGAALVDRLENVRCSSCPSLRLELDSRSRELTTEVARSAVKANIDQVLESWEETRQALGEVSTGQVEDEVKEPETLGVEMYGRS